ncbi:MAG: hypothetical protein CMI02_02685 [Oceanospirillaceae bacterium]|nr:hypothetical protein [Oceanospirillaceae bacterium]MBT10926.1 hypothetical protein [Oceanospirillaceae bacterium]|tara:strand:- start:86303 stop:86614 length:312 start_codon:yes stop_codon:yes gene_type:complete
MNATDQFEEIKLLSLEIRSLIKQGVREGVEEKIRSRNEKLQAWFAGISELIDMTNDQQTFLEQLLQEERQLVDELNAEQKNYSSHQKGKRQLGQYQQTLKNSH